MEMMIIFIKWRYTSQYESLVIDCYDITVDDVIKLFIGRKEKLQEELTNFRTYNNHHIGHRLRVINEDSLQCSVEQTNSEVSHLFPILQQILRINQNLDKTSDKESVHIIIMLLIQSLINIYSTCAPIRLKRRRLNAQAAGFRASAPVP